MNILFLHAIKPRQLKLLGHVVKKRPCEELGLMGEFGEKHIVGDDESDAPAVFRLAPFHAYMIALGTGEAGKQQCRIQEENALI